MQVVCVLTVVCVLASVESSKVEEITASIC
jgi:hypothetical protein